MFKLLKLIAVGSFGAMCYGIIELVNRGFSHISMGLLGAFSMLVIHELNGERRSDRLKLIYVVLISTLFITSGELLAGEILNRYLGMKIWNYKHLPLNFDGQICIRYSAAWGLLSLFGIAADEFFRKYIFQE